MYRENTCIVYLYPIGVTILESNSSSKISMILTKIYEELEPFNPKQEPQIAVN